MHVWLTHPCMGSVPMQIYNPNEYITNLMPWYLATWPRCHEFYECLSRHLFLYLQNRSDLHHLITRPAAWQRSIPILQGPSTTYAPSLYRPMAGSGSACTEFHQNGWWVVYDSYAAAELDPRCTYASQLHTIACCTYAIWVRKAPRAIHGCTYDSVGLANQSMQQRSCAGWRAK